MHPSDCLRFNSSCDELIESSHSATRAARIHHSLAARPARPGAAYRRSGPRTHRGVPVPHPVLFEPIRIGSMELANRIVIAPMCQYSAEDGEMTDWHLIHLGQLAQSGAALVTIEATAVVPEGRISYADVGLWDDRTAAAMGSTLERIRRWSETPIAVQLAHAGRKASTEVPWRDGGQLPPGDPKGWETVAPSAIPFLEGKVAPRALDRDGL